MLRFVFVLSLVGCIASSSVAANTSVTTAPIIDAVATIKGESLPKDDFSDLAAFGKAVGTSRYVVLGEKTHGEGNVFALKARLVRYLHDKLGFDVLAMESGLYDGAKIDALRDGGKPLRELAPGNIFSAYAKSKEIALLFDYLDAQRTTRHPLTFTTFDSQHSGALSENELVVDLANHLLRNQSELPRLSAWRSFAAYARQLIRFDRTAPPEGEQKRFFEMLRLVDVALDAEQAAGKTLLDDPAFWKRITANLRSQARSFWASPNPPPYNALREQAMADNLVWLLQRRYPDRKAVIWTHDFHGQKASLYPGAKGMMMRVRKAMPDGAFYHVYLTGYDGRYIDFRNGSVATITAPAPSSLETLLHRAGVNRGFIDLKRAQERHPGIGDLGIADYEGRFSKGKPSLREFADGIFYIDRITPSNGTDAPTAK